MHRSVADLSGSIVSLDARTEFIPDSIERRNRMRSVQEPTGSYGIVTSEVMERGGYPESVLAGMSYPVPALPAIQFPKLHGQ
jgi:hypothetical protein